MNNHFVLGVGHAQSNLGSLQNALELGICVNALGQHELAVVITVIAVRVMQAPINEKVDVIAMRHRLMTTPRPVLVTGVMARRRRLRRASCGMPIINGNPMLVDVILVGMVQMAIVQVVGVPVVTDRHMAAVGAVLVIVLGMGRMLGFGHGRSLC